MRTVKQIERDGSPQRRICALLGECFPLTVKQIAEMRGINARAICRQLDALVADGYVEYQPGGGHTPRLYQRTAKPLPAPVARAPRSEVVAQRRRREREALESRFRIPARGELERVVSAWVGA